MPKELPKSDSTLPADQPQFNQARNHLKNQIKLEERRIAESQERKAQYEAELAKLPTSNG